MVDETAVEVEPPAAGVLFGDRVSLARDYVRHLAEFGEELGLIGPLELPRLWSRHVLNSALVAPLVRAGGVVADVGSGAGLPGIVLAIARPDARFVLIEPMERRTDWLNAEVERLGLDNVDVMRARAEEAQGKVSVDQVTARAVSALSKLLPITAPLLRPGGELVLMKGAAVEREMESASKVIKRLRLVRAEVLVLGEGVVGEVTRVFRATGP